MVLLRHLVENEREIVVVVGYLIKRDELLLDVLVLRIVRSPRCSKQAKKLLEALG